MNFRLLFFCIFTFCLWGQDTKFSFGLSSFNGNAKTTIIQLGKNQYYPYNFSENFLDILAWRGQWNLWTNLEYSTPPRIGPSFAGLRKFRLSFEKDQYSIMAGDLYGQIGRGLGLNMWENQNIDWDSSLRGVWFKRSLLKRFQIDFIAGKARGGRHLGAGQGIDPRRRDFSEDENVAAIAGHFNEVIFNAELGVYLVLMNGNRSWFTTRESGDSKIVKVSSLKPGFFGKYKAENFDVFFEFAHRQMFIHDVDSLYSASSFKWYSYKSQMTGRGFYFSSSYYPGNWGLTLELKNYLFDKAIPDHRAHLPFKLGRSSLVTGPPSTFKEHSSILLSRTPHIMDLDDELGFQIEFNFQANEDLFVLLNYSRSSRHTAFVKNTDEFYNYSWNRRNLNSLFLPSSDYGFYPFHEGYVELNYRYDPFGVNFTAGLSQANEVILYNGQSFISSRISGIITDEYRLTEFFQRRNLISIPSKLSINLPKNHYVSINMEHQWEGIELVRKTSFVTYDQSIPDSVDDIELDIVPYYYRYSSITFGEASRFSISFMLDIVSKTKTGDVFNTDQRQDSELEKILRRNDISLDNKWFGVEASLYLTPSSILTLFFGSIQGGLKCDSGVCVYVPGMDDAGLISFTGNF